MKKSKFGTLNARDFLNGLFLMIITTIVTGVYELLKGGAGLDWSTLKPILLSAITASLGYLIKNLLTNSQGEILTSEKSPLVIKMNMQYGKVLIFALMLSGISLISSGQGPWKGFFKPVPKDLVALNSANKSSYQSSWKFRPAIELTALQLIYNKETKIFDASSLKSMGMGITYAHFIDNEGKPYNDFGVNALLLFDATPTQTTSAGLSGAITINALQFVNIGGGYNFGVKKFFLLTGITYNFN